MTVTHNHLDLVRIFNHCFLSRYNTELCGHAPEPFYTPATETHPARIDYRDDYFASALHEIAHWCIAGEQRRLLEDYGYWYEPDGRSQAQQQLFESVEIKPQAMEWIFSLCCRAPFYLSVDNLNNSVGFSQTFKDNVYQQAIVYLEQGLPERAASFAHGLAAFYRDGHLPQVSELKPERL